MKPAYRRRARKLAVQSLYQWAMSQTPVEEIETQFMEREDLAEVDVEYYHDLIHGVKDQLEKLDALFTPSLDRSISELTLVELCVLRLAVYELVNRLDVPYRVVINEALELTKIFGTVEGFKYVNGVLDQVAKGIRSSEMK